MSVDDKEILHKQFISEIIELYINDENPDIKATAESIKNQVNGFPSQFSRELKSGNRELSELEKVKTSKEALKTREFLVEYCKNNDNQISNAIKERLDILLPPTVVVLGPTGSGKSTLITALCGKHVLAAGETPFSVTSAAVKIVSEDIQGFEVEIEYVSLEEWEEIKQECINILQNPIDMKTLSKQKQKVEEKRQREAIELLNTVYGTSEIGNLTEPSQFLQPIPMKKFDNESELIQCIVQYSARKDFWKKCRMTRKLTPPETFYWPVVSQITVKGNFKNIPFGTGILDLPGYESDSSRRLKVIDSKKASASRIWFACAMERYGSQKHMRDDINKQLKPHAADQQARLLITKVQDIEMFEPQEVAKSLELNNAFIDRILPLSFNVDPGRVPTTRYDSEENFKVLIEDLNSTGVEFVDKINNLIDAIKTGTIFEKSLESKILSLKIKEIPRFRAPIDDWYTNRQLGQVPWRGGRTSTVYIASDVWTYLLEHYISDEWEKLMYIMDESPSSNFNVRQYLRNLELDFINILHEYFLEKLYSLYPDVAASIAMLRASDLVSKFCAKKFPKFWNDKLLSIIQATSNSEI